jgi:hypothetical protein
LSELKFTSMKKLILLLAVGTTVFAQDPLAINQSKINVPGTENNLDPTKEELSSLEEKSKKNRAIAVSISNKCFKEKKDGAYTNQVDLDNESITAFNTESLKDNPRYGIIDRYKEGFARISKDQVYGFLNLCGEETITCQYDFAEPFNGGKALVKKFFWFFVDANGNESEQLQGVVDAKAIKFGVSLAKFKNGKSAFISNEFDKNLTALSDFYDEITPFADNIFLARNGKTVGLILLDGSKKTDIVFERIIPSQINDWVYVYEKGKIGLQSLSRETFIKPTYDNISGYFFGNQVFFNAQNAEGVTLFDVTINRKSNTYRSIEPFNENGVAIIQSEAKVFGLMDKNMNILVNPQYTSFSQFNKTTGLAEVSKIAGEAKLYGFINEKGVEIISSKYEKVGTFSKHGFVVVTERPNGCTSNACLNEYIYNSKGMIAMGKSNEISRYTLTDTLFNNRYMLVETFEVKKDKAAGNGFNLIDKEKNKQLAQESFTAIKRMDSHIFAIENDVKKWGLLDTTGRIFVQNAYKEISFLSEGLYAVKYDNDKYGFINKTGKVQVSFDYVAVQSFVNGLAIVAKGTNKVGLINKFNAKVVPCVFSSIKNEGNKYVITDKSNNTFALDNQGNCTENCTEFYKVIKRENDK